jgi:iron(III) transport system ATP-binding protein
MTNRPSESSGPHENTIVCSGIRRHFGPTAALDGFDLKVPSGRITSLVGPSGCGKTTALRVIAGFEAPDAGQITIAGRTVVGEGIDVAPERRRVGMVFQDYALFPHMTVAANVGYGIQDRDRKPRVAEVLELVGLLDMGNRMPHELSGGEQQRVALARALAPEPDVILLDEPFSNLDAPQRDRMRREIRSILREAGATAVFVTHDQAGALAIADVVAVMRAGKVVQVGSPTDVYRNPADPWIGGFLGDSAIVPGVASGDRVETPLGTLASGGDMTGPVDVMLRPEWVTPVRDPEGKGVVVDREFYGHDQMLLIQLDDGPRVQSRIGPSPDLAPGDRVALEIDECVLYPATVSAEKLARGDV